MLLRSLGDQKPDNKFQKHRHQKWVSTWRAEFWVACPLKHFHWIASLHEGPGLPDNSFEYGNHTRYQNEPKQKHQHFESAVTQQVQREQVESAEGRSEYVWTQVHN